MSGLDKGNWDNPVCRRLLEVREDAVARGDHGVVAECDLALAKFGPGPVEAAIPAPLERAVPAKPARVLIKRKE